MVNILRNGPLTDDRLSDFSIKQGHKNLELSVSFYALESRVDSDFFDLGMNSIFCPGIPDFDAEIIQLGLAHN